MADQIYFTDGDFYQCATATSAGESPTTTPAKWRKIRLLEKWRHTLAQLTYANLLRLDGQNDKAQPERAAGYGRDRVGLDDLIRAEAHEEEKRRCHPRAGMVHPGAGHGLYVKASVILDDVYRLIGWDAAQLDDREKADARDSLSQAVQEVWTAWWWSQLMACTRLGLAEAWTDSNLWRIGEQVLYLPNGGFYQCLQDTDSEPPDDATNGNAYWARWVENDVPANWDSATTYAVADRVRYNGVDYQLVSTATTPADPAGDSQWVALTDWTPIVPYTLHSGAVAGPYGPLRGVSQFDPRTAANPGFFQLDNTADGTRVLGLTVTHPWVWSRRVTPILTGDAYDATATYEATPTANLVFDT